jgi:uncharacterized protein YqhQ
MRNSLRNLGRTVRQVARATLIPLVQGADEILIGGQAVIEGVMMRSPHSYAVAVRRPDRSVALLQKPLERPSEKHRWLKYPVVRGLGVLGQAMTLGIRALRYSAEQALEESGNSAKAKAASGEGGTEKKSELGGSIMALNLIFSAAFFIVFYKFLPLYLATLFKHRFPAFENLVLFNLVDGTIRIALFLGFLLALAQFKDMKRLFEYHGAEHKVVWAYEAAARAGAPGHVDFETARRSTRFHPRCGTSFLLVVMVIAMILYMFLPFHSFAGKFAGRILLLPLIVGVSYEFIRFAAKSQGALWRWAAQPGLWLQRVTTREPDDSQLEISIRALEAAMDLEKLRGGELVVA